MRKCNNIRTLYSYCVFAFWSWSTAEREEEIDAHDPTGAHLKVLI